MSEVNHKKWDIIKIAAVTTIAGLAVAIITLIVTCIIGREPIFTLFNPAFADNSVEVTNTNEMTIADNLVEVPNLNEMTIADAQAEILLKGFAIGKTSQAYDYRTAPNNSMEYNKVCWQSVEAGTKVAKGTTIDIAVFKGVKPICVGDYVFFEGGPIYISTTGSEKIDKPSSTNIGLYIITDALTNDRYGIQIVNESGRYGWVESYLVSQRTN